jgi:hypothetical protein
MPREPEWKGEGVIALCPGCDGAVSRFEVSSTPTAPSSANQYRQFQTSDGEWTLEYYLMRCVGCGRGALALVNIQVPPSGERERKLLDFYPRVISWEKLPEATPEQLMAEVREAEKAAGVGALRAATTLLRSALEKTLSANGYAERDLKTSIDAAASDGAITNARSRQVHDDVRRLGNDIVHDEWRVVDREEFDLALTYVVWILEDFYADRPTVEAQLVALGRLRAAPE